MVIASGTKININIFFLSYMIQNRTLNVPATSNIIKEGQIIPLSIYSYERYVTQRIVTDPGDPGISRISAHGHLLSASLPRLIGLSTIVDYLVRRWLILWFGL